MVHVMSEVKNPIMAPVIAALRGELDAQRLRADTAEADSVRKDCVIEDLMQSNSDMTTCLAAAEQRISELEKILRTAKSYIRDLSESLGNACEDFEGDEDEDPQAIEECDAARQFIDRIDAALNSKPEAGSHE